jgi:hypothetical protein
VPELWVPGAAAPSLDEFVVRVHRQIERFTATHGAERSLVEIELADGERFTLRSLSPEPGFGFVTLAVHQRDDDDPQELIVPIGAIRRIDLGPAEVGRAHFGFSLPDDGAEGAEPAA